MSRLNGTGILMASVAPYALAITWALVPDPARTQSSGDSAHPQTIGDKVKEDARKVGDAARQAAHSTAEAARTVAHRTSEVAKAAAHRTAEAAKRGATAAKAAVHGEQSTGAGDKPKD